MSSRCSWWGSVKASLLVALCAGIFVRAEEPAREAASQPAVGPAALRIEAEEHDFGVHWVDATPTFTFKLQNVGGSALMISAINANYGLDIVGEPPKEIGPGQSAELTVRLAADQMGVGKYERSVSLVTNDPAQSFRNLTVRGECKHYVELMPRAVSFGRISGSEPIERDITITNNTDEAMKMKIAGPTADGPFRFDLVETVSGRECRLFVGLLPPSAPGGVSASVTLETGIEKQKQVVVKVHAVIAEQIEVIPAAIRWPDPMRSMSSGGARATGDSKQQVTNVIQVAIHEAKPLELRAASCDDPKVKVELRPVFAGRLYHVLVSFAGDYQTPENGAMVALEWAEQGRSAVVVPIGSPRRPIPADRNVNARSTSGPAQANASGQAKPPPRRKPAMDLIGKQAPALGLTTEEGRPVATSEFQYFPATVLNFIAPNCGYSKKQIPRVEQVRAAYEDRGVRFVNVSMKMRKDFTAAETKAVMDSLGSSLELAIDAGNRTGTGFKVTGFPCLFIVRDDGTVDHVISGNKVDLEEQMHAHLDAILNGSPLPTGDVGSTATNPPPAATGAGT